MHTELTFWTRRSLHLGASLALLVACSQSADPGGSTSGGTTGAGGSTPSSGGSSSGGATTFGGAVSSGGATSGGATATSGGTVSTSGGATSGGATATSGGAVSTSGGTTSASGGSGGASTGGSVSSGGSGTAGSKSMGGAAGSFGTGGSFGTTGGTANGGSGSGGRSGTGGSTGGSGGVMPGGNNSVAYIGCSMANNIGNGYKRVGGKVMWNSDNYQTGAMVVQNWTSSTSASWQLFDRKMSSIGGKDTVKAIMVQICIFSSRATDAELRSMIASARQHVNPGTHIYLVGQPQYEAGHDCSLAGKGGAQWTDDQAKALAADSSINQDMTYLGQFKLDSTKGEVVQSDGCHATAPTGEDVLGNQAKAFFGG